MERTDGIPKKVKTRQLRFAFLAITLLLAITSSLVIFSEVGKWLVREDTLQPATAIAILSGDLPTSALEAAELYREGFAKQVWLTHPGARVDALKALGIVYPSEDDCNFRVLRREGVPARAIRVLDKPIVNTDDELKVISAALQSKGGQKVIIVTNKSHTRRVHVLWTKYFAGRGTAVVHAVPGDEFEADRWWRSSGDMTQVVHEVLGIVNAWADLPVRPHPTTSATVLAEGSQSSGHTSVD